MNPLSAVLPLLLALTSLSSCSPLGLGTVALTGGGAAAGAAGAAVGAGLLLAAKKALVIGKGAVLGRKGERVRTICGVDRVVGRRRVFCTRRGRLGLAVAALFLLLLSGIDVVAAVAAVAACHGLQFRHPLSGRSVRGGEEGDSSLPLDLFREAAALDEDDCAKKYICLISGLPNEEIEASH